MRTIDADALKEDLTRFYDGEVTARGLIDEQPTVGGLISVKERLPEKSGVYLVRLGHGTMNTMGFSLALWQVDNSPFKCKKPGWYEYDSEQGFVKLDDITHYMLIPEPPKEEN